MLGLQLPTDPRWVNLAEMNLEDVLTDHAYCEMKAASACISLIQLYPDKIRMVRELAPVVTEEWGHFRMVLKELDKRSLQLGRQRKDEYVNELMSFMDKPGDKNLRLVERLLVCALIEARSCERFRLLSLDLQDIELRKFYHHFMVAEAGHYRMFLDLAKHYGGEEYVRKRWQKYLDFEADLMLQLEMRGDRMH
ncbi:MAG TPA: tRNA-(ms[2]io[6]A)-hydroxylase [Saprospiraceae bacterium]|nr:tRNA-(ms[2]io[6]A)-hydroxylase [Saprospiraceae bacterium]